MQVVFTRLGVVIAMIFVSFPFVVRTMQPVMQVGQRRLQPPLAQLHCMGVSCGWHTALLVSQPEGGVRTTYGLLEAQLSAAQAAPPFPLPPQAGGSRLK